MTVLKNPLNHL